LDKPIRHTTSIGRAKRRGYDRWPRLNAEATTDGLG
jgi:hypothetical protein